MCLGVGPLRQTKNRELGRQPGTGHERERGRPEYSGGWTVPKAWGRRGGGTSRGGWRGARALPSPPTHQAPAKTGSVEARGNPGGRSLPFIRPDPHFSQPTHPHRRAPVIPQLCQTLASFHQLDFWGAQILSPCCLSHTHSCYPVRAHLSQLFQKRKSKKKYLPQAKHCAGHSSGPVAMPSHPSPWASPLPFHVPSPSRAPYSSL